jgi:outer membrane protein assembly factor BamB
VAIVIAQLLMKFGLPVVAPEAMLIGVIAGPVGGLAILVWWLFFSRALWSERLGAVVLMIAGAFVTARLVHESISNGMMGMMLPMYSLTVLSMALVVWAVTSRHLEARPRRAALVATVVLACGVFTILRTDGITGAGASQLAWRWTETAEERLLAQSGDESLGSSGPKALPAIPAAESAAPPLPVATRVESTAPAGIAADKPAPVASKPNADWPGFRGPNRDGVVRGVRIETDWSASPPVQMWRRPIGPGWSSFAVRGDVLYTQEQRGDDEIVAAYKVTTGEPVWRRRDPVRFWESNGGAGPRATPTLSDNRVYAFGATGILNALDADNGAVLWSRNVASDTGRKVPDWGFASSPLVVVDVVIVAAAGTLAGYDLATGNRRWSGPSYGGSYSSPHRVTVDGVLQVLLLGGPGAISVAPRDGAVLWQHAWSPGAIVQPALTADGDILISIVAETGGLGTRRIAVTHGSGGWTVEERWTSTGLKPYFNDFVVHKGHAFGFDGSILACIDLADGKRKWKGGRYGNGQLLLLADQDLLLVLSEEGELALVKAAPDQFSELARFPAIEGKTWNHPVLTGDILLVRNGQEMAAFRLSRTGR